MILFVCVENAGRSQMAEAFAKRYGIAASSAGTIPSSKVNPLVVQVMREKDIDIGQSRPRELAGEIIDSADLVVLTDASLEKAIPGNLRKKMKKKVVEWYLPDPQGKPLNEIRYIRDQIKGMVEGLRREAGLPARPK